MRLVVTSKEMREIDRCTIDKVGIPGVVLMENAGLGTVKLIEEILEEFDGSRITLLCGRGNNGGDGFVIARHLYNHGFEIDVFLSGDKARIQGDAKINLDILEKMGVEIITLQSKKDLKKIPESDLIVDALLGTGISGEVTGFLADVIHWMNESLIPIVSVDMPSGLACDTGNVHGACVVADVTATMAELKRGLVLPPGRELCGDISIIDISAPQFVSESVNVQTFLIEQEDLQIMLPFRPPSAHKGTFGKVLILAGSTGMTGAATLASMASLRVGCGLTILGIPQSLNTIMESKLTEVMTKPLPETEKGSLSPNGEAEILELIEWADVVGLGPGISTHPETGKLIRNLTEKIEKPLIVDADGLNNFQGHVDILKKHKGDLILTPHSGELSRLMNQPIDDIEQNRIEIARQVAVEWNCTLVLKGASSLIADCNGNVFINPTGNSGMATAGSGDILTGMIAGFLAQNTTPVDAAILGVYSHGLAGDLYLEEFEERSLVAGDLLEMLPAVFNELELDW